MTMETTSLERNTVLPQPVSADGDEASRERVRMHVVTLNNVRELQAHLPQMEELFASAIEPNIFYEPWMLIPNIEAHGEGAELLFVLIYAEKGRNGTNEPVLCGFFPFERKWRYSGIPVRVLTMWDRECALCTPPVREGYGAACLDALFDWIKRDPAGAQLLEWESVACDGPFYELLSGCILRHRWRALVTSRDRPLLVPRADADSYLRACMSGSHRSKLRQKERRLAELGSIEYVEVGAADAEEWIQAFLRLEASGWKGREGVALASNEKTLRAFRSMVEGALRRGRLSMLSLNIGGVPVACKCNIAAGSGWFAYKIAYDEKYARYSPGELLEIDNIRRVHARSDVAWMDSCVSRSFEHFYRWLDRRALAFLEISTGAWRAEVALTAKPFMAELKLRLEKVMKPRPENESKGPDNGRSKEPSENEETVAATSGARI